jgi:hypothetical protein
MPTLFKAQNGAVLRQNTKIAVSGCPKAKHKKHRHKGRHGHGKKGAGRK